MRKLVFAIAGICLIGTASAEMVSNKAIGNDPAKEKLCAKRAKGKPVPFVIDSAYVKRARAQHPDTTFIAIKGISPQLIECYQREGTGRFEPASMSPEQDFWHLPKPKQFNTGMDYRDAMEKAAGVCFDAVKTRLNKPGYSHSNYSSFIEVKNGNPRYGPGANIGKIKAKEYDFVVNGTSFYKSSGPDMTARNFTCLLSPELDVKTIQMK